MFWLAGYGTAGKETGEDVGRAHSGAKCAGNLRSHLEKRLVFLDCEEAVNPHTSVLADAAQIVAHQVHDHQVLTAILQVVLQPGAISSSSMQSAPRGAVPFMGRVTIARSCRRKN